MKNYKYFLFDLDGTITDSAAGIMNSIVYALKKFNIDITDKTELYKFIGPPLLSSFKKYFGFSDEDAKTALGYVREHYRTKGIFDSVVLDGFENLLAQLKTENKILIVATTKPEVYAKQILEYFNIDKYFTLIAGATFDETRTEKSDVIVYALDSCNISDTSLALMIGDREHDILGAKKAGMDSVGVLYGYGDRDELENAGATYIVKTVEELNLLIHAKSNRH